MKLKEQVVIEGNVVIPRETATLVGYRRYQRISIAGAKVLGDFDCSFTKIKSLKQGPSYVGGDFYCGNTKITSLKQGPSWVGGDFNCRFTNITSLHNIHKKIKHIGGTLFIDPIKSHILGVMFIKGLQKIQTYGSNVEQDQVVAIINKHLDSDRNIHLAQEELLEAGLKEYAKL